MSHSTTRAPRTLLVAAWLIVPLAGCDRPAPDETHHLRQEISPVTDASRPPPVPTSPGPATDCYELRRGDGARCTICYDSAGNFAHSSCRAPAPGCTPDAGPPADATPTPPPAPIRCRDDVISLDRRPCVVCVDDRTHQAVITVCGSRVPPGGAFPPPPATCKAEPRADGVLCTTCRDDSGQVLAQSCPTCDM
jgi:hypothetical protein